MINRDSIRSILSFGCVGAVGFAVDGGILSVLVQVCHIDVYLSRAVSFVTAVFTTWLLNRIWVFKQKKPSQRRVHREYLSYFFVQTIGALLNLGVFVALIHTFPTFRSHPIVPLAVGSVCAMCFNYSGSYRWVFRQHE